MTKDEKGLPECKGSDHICRESDHIYVGERVFTLIMVLSQALRFVVLFGMNKNANTFL